MIGKQKMPISGYLLSVVKPCVFVFIPAIAIVWALHATIHLHTVIMTVMFIAIVGTFILAIGLTQNERMALKRAIVSRFRQ